MRVFKDVELVEQLGFGMERIMKVYDKSNFEFLPNFLKINFYFDKEVMEYLGKNEQETISKTTSKATSKTPPKITYSNLAKTQVKILELVKENPTITLSQIADIIHLTKDGIKYNITILKNLGILQREGSNRKGVWKIIK